jgi:hypothetical protein
MVEPCNPFSKIPPLQNRPVVLTHKVKYGSSFIKEEAMKRTFLLSVILILILIPSVLLAQRGFIEESRERFTVRSGRPLEVLMDIDAGEVYVERGGRGEEGSVSVRFAEKEYSAWIDFHEDMNRLKIELEKEKWLRYSDDDEDFAEIIVRLPYDVDILFDARIKAGEVTMELGDLRMREFSLTNWAGEVEVRFDEPNRIPMDFMDVRAKVGECHLIGLGNARFKSADINGGIGEIDVDFSGDLEPDSRARVDLDIGEATISVPRDFGVRMSIGGGFSFLSAKNIDRAFTRRGKTYYTDNYEIEKNKFSLRITPGLGELNVEME